VAYRLQERVLGGLKSSTRRLGGHSGRPRTRFQDYSGRVTVNLNPQIQI
jgi:hypothetical protein